MPSIEVRACLVKCLARGFAASATTTTKTSTAPAKASRTTRILDRDDFGGIAAALTPKGLPHILTPKASSCRGECGGGPRHRSHRNFRVPGVGCCGPEPLIAMIDRPRDTRLTGS